MKTLLTANLTSKTAKLNGSAWEPPVQTFGETLTIAMRFEADLEGGTVERSLDVRGLWAAIGETDSRPARGGFAIQFGDDPSTEANTTEKQPHNVSATSLQAAINALASVVSTYGAARVVSVEGSWLIWFENATEAVPMKVVQNDLTPIAFGKVRARQIDGRWIHELRLVIAPVAFTDASERILPPPPAVTRIQAGGSEGEFQWNEIQALYVPPEFRGTFQLKRDYKRTALLSRSDGPDEILAAVSVFGDGFKVENPLPNTANIEFIGEFAGEAQDLLEAVVFNAPEGDLTFTLKLDRGELGARFRAQKEITLPLEVKLIIFEDDELKPIVAFRTDITIRGELIFEGLAEVPAIDWLRPTSPKDYVPSDPSQVITGQQHYPFVLGDGERTTIEVDHPLGTTILSGIVLSEVATGRVLEMGSGADYTVRIAGPDSVEFTFPTAPGAEAIAGVLTSAGPTSAFVEDLRVNIPQVNGLEAVLDDLGSRVVALEAVLPSTGPAAAAGAGTGLVITVPAKAEVMFWPEKLESLDDLPPRGPYLLPAVHLADASTPLPSPLPAANTVLTPTVYTNTGDSPVKLVTGGMVRDPRIPAIVPVGGFAACDGRAWYPVVRDGETNSYYPLLFERAPAFFFVNGDQFGVGKTLDFRFGVALRTVYATSRVTCALEVQVGTAPEDSTPSPTGPNLQNIVWRALPLLSKRIVVSDNETAHYFGIRIARNVGGLAMDLSRYGTWSGANDAAPSGPDFAVNVRLGYWDTENSVPLARGWVQWKFFGGEPGGAGDSAPAQVIIK